MKLTVVQAHNASAALIAMYGAALEDLVTENQMLRAQLAGVQSELDKMRAKVKDQEPTP